MGGAKFCRFALFPLMLFMLLLLPTRMVAQTTTEDPRYDFFKDLEGITDVTIYDFYGYPWQKLNLKAEGMENLGFTFPEGSKVLMSSNYHVNKSFPTTLIRFKVSKPILLTSQVLVSSEENCDFFSINVDDKTILFISGKMQTECKILLSAGEHALSLKYQKNGGGDRYADRAFLYNLKTSTTIDDYVADYESSNNTLTFKKIKSGNLGALNLNRIAMVYTTQTVSNMCDFLGVEAKTIKNIVFEENFKTYAPTSLNRFFRYLYGLQTITDLKYLNTANVTDMSGMFCFCEELSSLDLTNFITANVTDMSTMFDGCSALTTIYASDKFVTGQVTDGSGMFCDCSSLKGYSDSKTDHTYANYKTGYFSKLVGKNGEEKIGATGETLTTNNLVLDDGKDFVAYETFAAKVASYSRTMKEGTTWATLCLPFAIDLSQVKECKFYRLTGIDNDCITLESYEEGAKIPAGTPVLFKMNEGKQTLSISAQDAGIVKEPVAGTNTDVNLVGSFTKIGGKDNQGLADTDYIIGKDKFWRVSDLNDGKGVGIKPMRAYIHPATASQTRAAMLSIGKGDGTTAIDNLNAISNDANAEYYNANGRRTNGLQKGLNIVKRGSKTYKIMVK